jgi:hypothetical protein
MSAATEKSMTLERRVDRLWAVHEIRQLAYSYAYGLDSRDLELMRSLWADTDTPVQLPDMDGHYVRSSEFDRWFDLGPTILFVGNHRIIFEDDDHASGTVYCIVQMELDGAFVDQTILYQDRYVRQYGRWLFGSRRHLLWFGAVRDGNPFDQPPANWPEGVYGRGTLPEDFESYRRYKRLNG